jgi:hypothetical protein
MDDWEIRHPQELIRPIPDQSKLPWTRPEAKDSFINTCTINGNSAIPGLAIPGCMIPGNTMTQIETNGENRVAGDV